MAEETLLTAARRIVRFMGIDLAHGGLITEDTEKALLTLDKQVQKEIERERLHNLAKARSDGDVVGPPIRQE